MKKIIAILAIAICSGCVKDIDDVEVEKAWTYHGGHCGCGVRTKVVTIDGHKYIIMEAHHGGGVIHAASCDCLAK